MRVLLLTLSLCACASYRLPPTPTSYWIWESREAAEAWRAEHPVCITQVPDGYATEGC